VCRRDRLGLWDEEWVVTIEDPPKLTECVALADVELARVEVESRSVGAFDEALELEGKEFCLIWARVLAFTEFTETVEVEAIVDWLVIVMELDCV
jgi:hypothetical protein